MLSFYFKWIRFQNILRVAVGLLICEFYEFRLGINLNEAVELREPLHITIKGVIKLNNFDFVFRKKLTDSSNFLEIVHSLRGTFQGVEVLLIVRFQGPVLLLFDEFNALVDVFWLCFVFRLLLVFAVVRLLGVRAYVVYVVFWLIQTRELVGLLVIRIRHFAHFVLAAFVAAVRRLVVRLIFHLYWFALFLWFSGVLEGGLVVERARLLLIVLVGLLFVAVVVIDKHFPVALVQHRVILITIVVVVVEKLLRMLSDSDLRIRSVPGGLHRGADHTVLLH